MNNKKHGENYQNDIIFMNENDPFQIKHRKRTSKKQLEILEKTFEGCIRPDAKLRKKLGEQLGMTPRAVQIWFQNRRAKVKKTTGRPPKRKGEEYTFKEEENVYNTDYNTVEVYDTSEMYKKYGKEYGDKEYSERVYGDKEYSKEYVNQFNTYSEGYPYEPNPILIENRNNYPTKAYPPLEYNPYGEYNTYSEYPQEMVPYPSTDFGYPNEYHPTGEYPPSAEYHPTAEYPPLSCEHPPLPFEPTEDYYHKHHDEYYHNMYIDNNGCYKGPLEECNNVGYPPQYVDRQYYKDYYYKQHYKGDERDKE